ncbi:family 2A encapsulin nanocompartment cargo protein cysteine desulfurase [Methylocystis suflitae]|uniref:family 2A encapsulin nanocompartment cargo protein cysteine desulfurase n=1 Tax=Methylocystis suflitae TaxID=2951405 RepID=UPI00210AD15B|nr:family 2A encapsulin nanocompartment cargo protein cysteine desulfurase [Methylocystis suflitae]MCQ4190028.1 SufS family cysteine desulfurase [Methylocystis suflitae]
MPTAPQTPQFVELPVDGLPSEDPFTHHDAAAPDAQIIAHMANAFFGALPHATLPTNGAVTQQSGAPALAGALPAIPAVTPSLTDIPAPSLATSVAPHAPARAPFGPMDFPPTTIPSVVPTPNVPAPSAPQTLHSSTRPLGLADIPQPGASLGGATSSVPGELDYSEPTRRLAQEFSLVETDAAARPPGDYYFLPTAPAPGRAEPLRYETRAPSTGAGYGHPDPFSPQQTRGGDLRGDERVSRHSQGGATQGEFAQAGGASDDAHSALHSPGAGARPSPTPRGAAPASYGGDGIYAAPRQGRQRDKTVATRDLFDPYRVKRDFPILNQSVNGRQLVWLDNAATTQKPQSVIDRLAYFYENENSNIHRAAHTLAARATDAYEEAREKVRRFLKAPNVKDIIFVRGATEGINLVAQSWGRRNVREGDEIVVSHLEHHANIVPWQMLCAEKGAKLRVAPVDDRGALILDEYERLLNPKTRIVAVSQVSNALGTITPVHEVTAIAHRYGACVLVDGAQSVSHMPVDVQSIGCDFFVFSGHKAFGPTGIGVVYGKDAVLEHLDPWQGGGNMIADVTFEKTVYQGPPERFEAGTGNIADAVGLGAALDYVEAIGMEVIARYEHDLLVYATEKMKSVPGLTLIGTAPEKASVLSFTLDGHDSQEVGKALDREGIAVRAGHHCAQPILRRFGLEATVRPSLAFYNTCTDVDALVDALLRLQQGRAV